MKEGGVSRFFFENFSSQSTEKYRRGTFLVFTNILVSKTFLIKKGGGGGREYHDYLSKVFRLTIPKNFVGEPFCVSQSFWYRNKLCIRGGGRTAGVSRYSVSFSLPHCTENFHGATFLFLQYLRYRKTL